MPYVCCSYSNCFGTLREEDFSSVTVDDHKTAYQAVESLIKLGHRRIAVLLPSCNDRSVSELRYNGYCAALRDNGIAFDSALVAETGGGFEMPESYTGMCRPYRQRRGLLRCVHAVGHDGDLRNEGT